MYVLVLTAVCFYLGVAFFMHFRKTAAIIMRGFLAPVLLAGADITLTRLSHEVTRNVTLEDGLFMFVY